VREGVAVTVGDAGAVPQPTNALFTASTAQLMYTPPSGCGQNDAQALTAALPSAMLTPRISSLIRTSPSPLQSPTHTPTVGVGVRVAHEQSAWHSGSRQTSSRGEQAGGGLPTHVRVGVTSGGPSGLQPGGRFNPPGVQLADGVGVGLGVIVGTVGTSQRPVSSLQLYGSP